jgi:hypothetical protein
MFSVYYYCHSGLSAKVVEVFASNSIFIKNNSTGDHQNLLREQVRM